MTEHPTWVPSMFTAVEDEPMILGSFLDNHGSLLFGWYTPKVFNGPHSLVKRKGFGKFEICRS